MTRQPDQAAMDAATQAAHKMIQERGEPHWHDLRDMCLLGEARMLARVLEMLRSEEANKVSIWEYGFRFADWLERQIQGGTG